jgi:hypothetical protein
MIIETYLFYRDAEWRTPKADIRYKRKEERDKGKPFRTGFDLNHGGQKKMKKTKGGEEEEVKS